MHCGELRVRLHEDARTLCLRSRCLPYNAKGRTRAAQLEYQFSNALNQKDQIQFDLRSYHLRERRHATGCGLSQADSVELLAFTSF